MRYRQFAAVWLVCATILLSACAAQTFNQKAALGYTIAEGAVLSTSTLLNAQKIGSDDAENILKQADLGKQGIDIARSIQANSPEAANDKLTAALAGLRALEAYLLSQEAKK